MWNKIKGKFSRFFFWNFVFNEELLIRIVCCTTDKFKELLNELDIWLTAPSKFESSKLTGTVVFVCTGFHALKTYDRQFILDMSVSSLTMVKSIYVYVCTVARNRTKNWAFTGYSDKQSILCSSTCLENNNMGNSSKYLFEIGNTITLLLRPNSRVSSIRALCVAYQILELV